MSEAFRQKELLPQPDWPLRMPQTLARHLLWPLHERLRGRETPVHLRALQRGERAGGTWLSHEHTNKLEALLAHCSANVPYYREILAGSPPDLEAFSVLERDSVRERGRELLADNASGPLLPSSTGGSTGRPLVFWSDRVKEARHNAQKLRFRGWFGIRPGDRQVDFWGSPIELSKASRMRVIKDRYFLNQVVLSAHDLTPERLEAYVRFLGRFRPRLVYGYPTVIVRVAQTFEANPGLARGWRPQVVVCTSEMLYPQVREQIAGILRCPVANEYGSRDGGLVAHECPHGRLHIATEHVHVEVDQPDEDGIGDLLITNLDGYSMPFVRYRVGDRGRLGDGADCPCGSPLPTLDRLEGRRNDFLAGSEGRRVHGSAANYVMREMPQVAQYRLVQRADLSLDIEVIANGPWGEAETRAVTRGMQGILHAEVPVRLKLVDHIAPSPSGKYRWVESEALES